MAIRVAFTFPIYFKRKLSMARYAMNVLMTTASLCFKKIVVEEWQNEYNPFGPHTSLGNLKPRNFAEKAINM